MPALLPKLSTPRSSSRRWLSGLGCLAVLWLARAAVAAETYDLAPKRHPRQVMQVVAQVSASGQVHLVADSQTIKLPLKLSATMEYDERLLELNAKRTRLLRHYRLAEANIRTGEGQIHPRLNSARSQIAIQLAGDQRELLPLEGLLTREELDLLQFPGGNVAPEALLPPEPVAVGQTWKPTPDVLAQLLAIDAVGNGDVQALLAEILPNGHVKIVLSGSVAGAIDGVATEIDIEGQAQFDPKAGLFRALSLNIKEQRPVGHVGPGLDVQCQVTLRYTPATNPAASEISSLSPNFEKLPRQLAYIAPSGRLQLNHGRAWHVVDQDNELLVLRMVERGELVAQCNVTIRHAPASGLAVSQADAKTNPPDASQGHVSLDKFVAEVQSALGERFEKFLVTRTLQGENGLTIHHVAAEGNVSGLPIQWTYYLAQDDLGNRAAFVFTLEPKLLDKLLGTDLAMVRSLKFTGGTVQTSR